MSRQQNEEDTNSALFDARNEYYIGNYMGSINFVLPDQSTAGPELLSYMYLSYLAIDSGRIVASDIKENNTTPLQALRLVHEAIEQPSRTEELLEKLTDKVAGDEDETNIWHIATAIVYCRDGQFENALKILHGSTNLESMALSVQCLLRLQRVDLAKQLVTKMQEISDDATLTQLAQGWVALAQGTEQMQDAFHIYQEFCEKFKPTPALLNGQAVVHLGLERYEEADSVLRESLLKKHNDYDTLINLMVLAHLTGKPSEAITRNLEQLRQFYPKSDFVTDLDKKSAEFDRLCLQYDLVGEDKLLAI
ncbi:coatomer subunit epsilon [Drosophila bipectinata]|uniref:coatomer subunit epsilon n=1 Tax=Drosophila bipectinata TaxID=42026 RepID=UPI001C89638F|nr:coatomer subunit epsilon [Drosophila bipectinata]